MGLTKPFAFLGTSGQAEFDPTLGGTLEPAHWYDFTDDTTMTFSGDPSDPNPFISSDTIIAITSKGSISGSLARASNLSLFPKYDPLAYWIGPKYDPVNKLTIFSGSVSTSKNSTLARKYGTSPGYDLGFANGDQYTTAVFYEGNWNDFSVGQGEWVVSNKGNGSTGLPEEDSWARLSRGNYAGTNNPVVDSVASTDYLYTGHRLSYLSPTNLTFYMSYSGSSEVVNGIGPFVSLYRVMDGTDTSTGFNVKFSSTNTGSADTPLTRDGNNSLHENLSIGSRSRTNAYGGTTFRIRHLLSYKTILTGANIDAINASYAAAYPNDNFNPLP